MSTYTVKSGDSLSIIARDQLDNIDRWNEVAMLNKINSPYTIYPGQVINLPEKQWVYKVPPASDTGIIAPTQKTQNAFVKSSWNKEDYAVAGGLLLLVGGIGYSIYKNQNKHKRTAA